MKIVRNTESDEREVLGTFVAVDESGDAVLYLDADGENRIAPYDCVAIEEAGRAPKNVTLAPPTSRRIVIDLYDHTPVEEITDIIEALRGIGVDDARIEGSAALSPNQDDKTADDEAAEVAEHVREFANRLGVNPHAIIELARGYVTLPKDNALARLGRKENR